MPRDESAGSRQTRSGEEIVAQLQQRHTNGYGCVKWDGLIRDLGERYTHGGLTLAEMEAAVEVATKRASEAAS
jgi:hypothetical protein